MSSQTILTIIVVLFVLIWLVQLYMLFVATENQGGDPFRAVSGAAIFFPVPFPAAQIFPDLIDGVGGFWESLVTGIFSNRSQGGGGYAERAPAGARDSVARLLVDNEEMPLSMTRTRLGRYPNNEVVIENSTVSAYHAEIIRRPDGRHEIVDRESRNGTRVNGGLVRSQILKDRDLITLGGATLHYLRSPVGVSEPAAAYPPPETTYEEPEDRSTYSDESFRRPE